MGKVWGTYHRQVPGPGVLAIPLARGTNPCIGLAVSQDPRAPRVWGSMGHARAPLRVNSLIQPKPTSKGPQRLL